MTKKTAKPAKERIEGGSYIRDPKTGKRVLQSRTQMPAPGRPPKPAPETAPVSESTITPRAGDKKEN